MKNLLSCAVTFIVLLGPVQGTVGAPVFEDRVLLTSGKGGYHTYRIPAAVCTAKGTVLFFCEARKNSSSDFAQTHLLLLSSSDRGRTWSDPRIVWKGDSEPNVTIGNPCPVLDVRTGTVWIGFTRNNQRAFVTNSTDDGRTWATPTEITEAVKPKNWKRYWIGPGHGLQLTRGLKAGRLIFPSYHIVDEGDRRVMPSHSRQLHDAAQAYVSVGTGTWIVRAVGDPQAAVTIPAAVMADGARHCRFEECEVTRVGTYGVWFRRGCKDNRIVQNHIFRLKPDSPALRLGFRPIDTSTVGL